MTGQSFGLVFCRRLLNTEAGTPPANTMERIKLALPQITLGVGGLLVVYGVSKSGT